MAVDHIIIRRGRDYTLLRRDAKTPEPYVVAWKYNDTTHDWAQGHYFADISAAFKFFDEKEAESW